MVCERFIACWMRKVSEDIEYFIANPFILLRARFTICCNFRHTFYLWIGSYYFLPHLIMPLFPKNPEKFVSLSCSVIFKKSFLKIPLKFSKSYIVAHGLKKELHFKLIQSWSPGISGGNETGASRRKISIIHKE